MIHGFTPCGVQGTESELGTRKAVALTAVLSPALGGSIFFFKFLPLRPPCYCQAASRRGDVAHSTSAQVFHGNQEQEKPAFLAWKGHFSLCGEEGDSRTADGRGRHCPAI